MAEEKSSSMVANDGTIQATPGFTARNKVALISLCLINLFANMGYSVLAPFFPDEAKSAGINSTLTGLVFGTFAVMQFVCSPVFGTYIHIIGRRRLMLLGLAIEGAALFSFAFVDNFRGTSFFVVCLVIRAVMGLGAACAATAQFAIVAAEFPAHLGTVMGVLETCSGLGMMVGPVVGGGLYQGGGFMLPFLVLGGFLLVSGPLTVLLIPADHPFIVGKARVKLSYLLQQPSVFLTCGAVFFAMCSVGLLEPTLSIHLDPFGLSAAVVGVIFMVPTLIYALVTPLATSLSRRFGGITVMASGLLVGALGLLTVGPFPPLHVETSIALVMIGLCLTGLSIGLTFIPSMPYMIECNMSAGEGVSDVISGVLSSALSLGSAVGPMGGGSIVDAVGFSWSSAIFGFILAAYGSVLVIYRAAILNPSKSKHKQHSSVLGNNDAATPLLSAV
eukprot:GILK01007985.1.p1 GENE.GILK01007985.1~~GILK01007985.1.p1  ORF type:complete len:458 (-),score=61.49 GILK01007985.1:153-1490(-)